MAKGKDKNIGPNWVSFTGYASPNYTPVPDELFDEHLAFLSGGELKVLLYIIRRTFGFKKDSDSISLSQMLSGIRTKDDRVLDYGVGLSKPTLLQALRSLVDKNLILTERRRSTERGDEPTVYTLRLSGGPEGGQNSIYPVVKKFDQGGGKEISPGAWSKNLTTQEIVIQETDKQDIDKSNIRLTSTSRKEQKNEDSSEVSSQQQPPRSERTQRRTGSSAESPQTGFTSIGALYYPKYHRKQPSEPLLMRHRGSLEPVRISKCRRRFGRSWSRQRRSSTTTRRSC